MPSAGFNLSNFPASEAQTSALQDCSPTRYYPSSPAMWISSLNSLPEGAITSLPPSAWHRTRHRGSSCCVQYPFHCPCCMPTLCWSGCSRAAWLRMPDSLLPAESSLLSQIHSPQSQGRKMAVPCHSEFVPFSTLPRVAESSTTVRGGAVNTE